MSIRFGILFTALSIVAMSPGWCQDESNKGDSQPALIRKVPLGDYACGYTRLGDLNGDGQLDVLFIQGHAPGNPPGYQGGEDVAVVTCLTAIDLEGHELWQLGEPDPKNQYAGGDHPVQIYDFNEDGANEVIYMPDVKNVLNILEGKTGKVLKQVQLEGGHDSILFADFTGGGHALDLLVKDRYRNFWVFDKDFGLLWNKRECNPGHYPAVYDVNGDGAIELFCGYTLYARDGRELWSHPELGGHADAVYIDDMDADGKAEIAVAGSQGETTEQATLLDADGHILFRKVNDHCQFVFIAPFQPELGGKQACFVDRQIYRYPEGHAKSEIALYLKSGQQLWSRVLDEGDICGAALIERWKNADAVAACVCLNSQRYAPPRLMDGHGEIVAVFPFPEAIDEPSAPAGAGDAQSDARDVYGPYSVQHANCFGDAREEIFLINREVLCVWTNAAGVDLATQQWRTDMTKLPPQLVNHTVYAGRG